MISGRAGQSIHHGPDHGDPGALAEAKRNTNSTHPAHLALPEWLVPLVDPVEVDFEAKFGKTVFPRPGLTHKNSISPERSQVEMNIHPLSLSFCLIPLAASLLCAQKPGSDSARPAHSSGSPATSISSSHSDSSDKSGNSSSSGGGAQDLSERKLPRAPKAPKVPKPPKLKDRVLAVPGKVATGEGTAGPESTPSATAIRIPVIAWNATSSLSEGQPLSFAVPAATADAPGTMTYMPPLTSIPPRGLCIVTARFTPTDPKQYSPATATVTVKVE